MADSNPFTLPSDAEIFQMRENKRGQKLEMRQSLHKLPIHKKTTASSTFGQMNRVRLLDNQPCASDETLSMSPREARGLVAAATSTSVNDRFGEKESMIEFIAKKREMFLVQMSLDTKREEIRKLEDKAKAKEDALLRSEALLDEDAAKFDLFLKANDRKAHDAIKRAEKETKAKTEKLLEIKKLNQQIQLVQSDMSKLNEQLQDCLQYKAFLDELTPPEYEEEQLAIKKARKVMRLEAKKNKILSECEEEKECIVGEIEDQGKGGNEVEKVRKSRPDRTAGVSSSRNSARLSMPNLDDLSISSSDEEIPLYFKHPQQLLDIFTALEESNLFLIKNSQDTEHALEELKQNYHETRQTMDRKSQNLKQSIDDLHSRIESEEKRTNHLRVRSQGGNGEKVQEKMLKELHDHVLDVYIRCGFDAETNASTLYMLTNLEARLEGLLAAIEQLPEDYVAKAEKDKEKERRERVRQERLTQKFKMYEERTKKAMERSLQAPKKRKGRKIMWRSQPLRQVNLSKDVTCTDQSDENDQRHFVW